ncbi:MULTISPECIES: ABC transporter permease [unclassified Streptomyces]|uniref:ABC transporter permease n=1 Tax=unclassified Streptomyces TaxID=2593676 RepID=UPI002250732A|nr:ABC transporter permease [Streptomyces sp. NBC_00047]MCX5606974.1 ABC transporter permease [Streptomyces sp. NBC_00047]
MTTHAAPAPAKHLFRDCTTMLRRQLKHALRYPGLSIGTIAVPVVFLLLFVYVLGRPLAAGIGTGAAYVNTGYINYLAPGILLMTVTAASTSTAVSVCTDLTEGIVARFRTMAISRSSILVGHVVGSFIQTMVSVGIVIGLSLLMGFRPNAGLTGWLAALGLIALLTFAVTWLAVALGTLSKTPEGASNIVMPLALLPFIGSAFVPTDSMPTVVRVFAEYQPFTPVIETIRALLMDTPAGSDGIAAVAWCVGIAAAACLWANKLFNRPA